MKAKTICIMGACSLGTFLLILPNLGPGRRVQRPYCVNNLRQLEGSKQPVGPWKFHKGTNDAPT